MQWSDLPVKPSPRLLRQFAGLWIVFFGGLAVWHELAHGETRLAFVLGAVAITIGPAGLVWPSFIRPLFVGWLVLAFPIGWVVSRVLLVALFLLITPVAMFFRVRGYDELKLRRRQGVTTYWTPKVRTTDVRSYLRQF